MHFSSKRNKAQFAAGKKVNKIAPALMKEFGKEWSGFTDNDKEPYKQKAKDDKLRYEKEFKEFALKCGSIQKIREWEKNRPKKPLSSYMIFVKETRAKVWRQNPKMHALQVMKEVGKLWKNLDQSSRKLFDDQAQVDKLRFLKEMKVFEKELNSMHFEDQEEKLDQDENNIDEKYKVDLPQDMQAPETNIFQYCSNASTSTAIYDANIELVSKQGIIHKGSESKRTAGNSSQSSDANRYFQQEYRGVDGSQEIINQPSYFNSNGVMERNFIQLLAWKDEGEAIKLTNEEEDNEKISTEPNNIPNLLHRNFWKDEFNQGLFEFEESTPYNYSQAKEQTINYDLLINKSKDNALDSLIQESFEYHSDAEEPIHDHSCVPISFKSLS